MISVDLGRWKLVSRAPSNAEVESGIDEDVGLAGLGGDAAVGGLSRGELESTDRGSADGDDATAGVAGALDFFGGLGRDGIPLAMDFVFLHNFDADGLKGAEPDVEGDFGGFDAAGADTVENLGSEVQSRGGRGDRADWLGIDGLVSLAIGGRVGAIDVGRKRDVPDAFDYGEEIRDRIEVEMALAKFAAGNDFGSEFVGVLGSFASEVDALADAELSSGMNESFPNVGFGRELAGK